MKGPKGEAMARVWLTLGGRGGWLLIHPFFNSAFLFSTYCAGHNLDRGPEKSPIATPKVYIARCRREEGMSHCHMDVQDYVTMRFFSCSSPYNTFKVL